MVRALVRKTNANVFPPRPLGLKGRHTEVRTLVRLLQPGKGVRVALVGSGGSGKSMLACAVGHRVRSRFPGGAHWFRSGPWDASTLVELMAIRFGAAREDRAGRLRALGQVLAGGGECLVVLDNHENDAAVATLLNALAAAPVTWMLTARRCLLSGLTFFPVAAPQAITGQAAFVRVRALTSWLRQNPLALDIADALVRTGAASVPELRAWLAARGVLDVRAVDHEDDLPEVSLLVEWAWARLAPSERRMMAVLAATDGDHVDGESLARLAALARSDEAPRSLARLRAWHLVQTPLAGRYALHAVVRHAVLKRTKFPAERFVKHYVELLERAPQRLDLEQTHLYGAMDYAHTHSLLGWMLRIERLLARLADAQPA
jgi:hypothetical protein